jgi:hypothetical protein
MNLSPDVVRFLPLVDEAMRQDSRELRDSIFTTLLISTAVVVIGIVMEGPEIIHETFWERRVEKAAPGWFKVLGFFGWLLIVGGVAGEFVFEAFVSTADNVVQRLDNVLLSSRQSELDRVLSGERANSALQEQRNLETKKQLDIEERNTARFQVSATKAQRLLVADLTMEKKFSADAATRLEDEKKKRVELAAGLLPRSFGDQSGTARELSGFSPLRVVFQVSNERESLFTAEAINWVFGLVKWPTSRRIIDESLIDDGVTIAVGVKLPPLQPGSIDSFSTMDRWRKLRESTGNMAIALSAILQRQGIDAKPGILSIALDYPPSTLVISVGPKPNHALEETLRELGPPNPAAYGSLKAWGNRTVIKEEDISVPTNSKKP